MGKERRKKRASRRFRAKESGHELFLRSVHNPRFCSHSHRRNHPRRLSHPVRGPLIRGPRPPLPAKQNFALRCTAIKGQPGRVALTPTYVVAVAFGSPGS